MGKYITEVEASRSESEEQQLKSKGFEKIDVDLNKGAVGSYIYLWYKRGSEAPITRMQASFSDETSAGLTGAGYKKISDDLNARALGDHIYLWYYRGSTEFDTPIVDLTVTTEAADEAPLYFHGWQRVGCDLNRKAGGKYIYAWVKREKPTYICDVFVTDKFGADTEQFKAGYIRVDEDLNRGAGGAWVFLWYRLTTKDKAALSRLDVSSDDKEYESLKNEGYQVVTVNLNEGAGGKKRFLWYKKDAAHKPIQALSVLVNRDAVDPYKKAGVQVLNLKTGNANLIAEHLAYYH